MCKTYMIIGISAVAFLIAAGQIDESQAVESSPVIGTPDQVMLDRRSIEIYRRPEIKRGLKKLESLLQADPVANNPEAKLAIPRVAASTLYEAVQLAVNSDPDRPKIMRYGEARYRWNGIEVPSAGAAFNNQDVIYRFVPIDHQARYSIFGKLPLHKSTQIRFSLFKYPVFEEFLPGLNGHNVDGRELIVSPDGSFHVTIDRDPENGRDNHIQIVPGAEVLLVRETFADWAAGSPANLAIRRTSGPPPKRSPTDAEIARRALDFGTRLISDWSNGASKAIYQNAPNEIPHPTARIGAWGYLTAGHFLLATGEALLVTLDPSSAAYLGFELCDPWGVPFEFIDRTSSLSLGQVELNSDGTVTYVISKEDPGIHNWLDTTGFSTGTFAIRWQKLTDPTLSANAIRSVKLVKVTDLSKNLPIGTKLISPLERARQVGDRRISWMRRLD